VKGAIASALPPVVLLHGWGGSSGSTWVRPGWVDDLRARGREVTAIDLPGHGASKAPHDPAYYAEIVEIVESQLPQAPVLDVVGFSLGGKLAILLALGDPGRFRRLVVAGVGENIFSREQGGELLAAVLRDGITDDCPAPLRDMVVYVWQSGNDPEAILACLTRPWTPPTPEQITGLSTSILLAAAAADPVAGSLDPLAACLPNAEVIRLAGVDHLSTPYSRQLRVSALDFLSAESTASYQPVAPGELEL